MNVLPGKISALRLSFWNMNLSVWLLFGVICLVGKVYFYPDLASGLTLLLTNLGLALLFSAVLRFVYRGTKLTDFFGLRTLIIVLAASLAAAFLQSIIAQNLVNQMEWGNPELPKKIALSHRIEFTWVVFLAWSFGYYGIKAKRAAHQAMLQSLKSGAKERHLELQLLRTRIAPHFLFNSLNGIAAEIAPHPESATKLIHDVSDYLRHLLAERTQILSPLASELDAMSSYLSIEKTRFGERLEISLESTRPARHTLVPCFLLQPLVENAIKHAHWPETEPLVISIRATREKETLSICVTNSGALQADRPEGVGLSTLRRLLEIHYPDRHEFTLQAEHGKVLAMLILKGNAL